MLRLLSLAVIACALGACASKNLPPEYAGLNEAAVLETYGYPVDRRVVADGVVVLVFSTRLGGERFVTLVNDEVESVHNERNLSLLRVIPVVIN